MSFDSFMAIFDVARDLVALVLGLTGAELKLFKNRIFKR